MSVTDTTPVRLAAADRPARRGAVAKTLTAAVSAILLLAAGGRAQAAEPLALSHFPSGKPICYGRVYDAAHLKRQPAQKTVEIVFGRSSRLNSLQDSYYVAHRARTTARWSATGSAELVCRDGPAGLDCHGECDGFPLAVRADGSGILVTLKGGACGEDEDFGPADRQFRLTRLPAPYCATAESVFGQPQSWEGVSPFPPIPTE